MLNERRFKLVVLGTTGVGKTCLTLRFVRGHFDEEQLPTIGAAYMTKKLTLSEATSSSGSNTTTAQKTQDLIVEIWDTAGQERYEAITPLYYRSAEAAIIAFDLTSKYSFNKAKDWLKRLRKERPDPNMPIALAGNKFDLYNKVRSEIADKGPVNKETTTTEAFDLVDESDISSFVKENNLKYFKTSAKSGENIDEMFKWLASNLPKLNDEKKGEIVFPLNNESNTLNTGCC